MSDRPLRYIPEKDDFVIINGTHRFNRPLYCLQSPFLVYAGDLPEFLISLPGKGGVLRLGVLTPGDAMWFQEFEHIEARYRPGSMVYKIRGGPLRGGEVQLQVLPLHPRAGFILLVTASNLSSPFDLVFALGGANGYRGIQDLDLTGYNDESVALFRPDDCRDNDFDLLTGGFRMHAPCYGGSFLQGTAETGWAFGIGDAASIDSPRALLSSCASDLPVVGGRRSLGPGDRCYLAIELVQESETPLLSQELRAAFKQAEFRRCAIAEQIRVSTPDPYIDAMVPALCIATEANWEKPSWLHGAISWRMHFPGWRGAYAGTALGWWDRQQTHFSAYSDIRVKEDRDFKPHASEQFHLARQHHDSILYSRGYIPSMYLLKKPREDWYAKDWYNMNEVLVDQLFQFYQWSGDSAFIRSMWPVIDDHLAWQKRCFDADGDGLYESFADIHLSDGIQYSGAGCMIASAYTWRALDLAARYAPNAGQDPEPYRCDALHTLGAVNSALWMPREGRYAECKDILGECLLHTSLQLPAVYHAIDSRIPDIFQAYQCLRYVDTGFEHVTVRGDAQMVYTTNWVPVTNATRMLSAEEIAHTALANWQGGRRDTAYRMFLGTILDGLYCSRIPGNFIAYSEMDPRNPAGQITDHADTVGIYARALVEGLFGITLEVPEGEISIRPGFPREWERASIETPYCGFRYRRDSNTEWYEVTSHAKTPLRLRLILYARLDRVASATAGGKPVEWRTIESVLEPQIEILTDASWNHQVEVTWTGNGTVKAALPAVTGLGEEISVDTSPAEIHELYDPQKVFKDVHISDRKLTAKVDGLRGHRTAFVLVSQGDLAWWLPVKSEIRDPVEIASARVDQTVSRTLITLRNNTYRELALRSVMLHDGKRRTIDLSVGPQQTTPEIQIPSPELPGTCPVRVEFDERQAVRSAFVDWTPLKFSKAERTDWYHVPLQSCFNDALTNIFKHEYRSPRSPYCSLQIPLHGVGEWCYFDDHEKIVIDDSTVRAASDSRGLFFSAPGVPFATPRSDEGNNVVFVSQWDNFPTEARIPLEGRSNKAYFLLAGSTNLMQSQLDNGEIIIRYRNGSRERLVLHNPTTWWPLERDYDLVADAFCVPGPLPPRIELGNETRGIILDLCLDPSRDLSDVTIRAIANEVIIGLMAITLAPVP